MTAPNLMPIGRSQFRLFILELWRIRAIDAHKALVELFNAGFRGAELRLPMGHG